VGSNAKLADTPVIVIGSSRSGTSMLVELLGRANDAHSWYEAMTVWRVGHAWRNHDRATSNDVTSTVQRRVHAIFREYQARHNGCRIVEKTPENVLRVPYIHAIFPDAKIVHIIRDGRDYLQSQLEMFAMGHFYKLNHARIMSHFRHRLRYTPWWEWPAYMPRVAKGIIHRHLLRKPGTPWFGVRYPGWTKDRDRLTLPQICAHQWVWAVTTAMADLREIDQSLWMEIKYEQFTSAPREHLARIFEFCGLEGDNTLLDELASTVNTRSVARWQRDLPKEALDEAMPIMGELLAELGYTDALPADADPPAKQGM